MQVAHWHSDLREIEQAIALHHLCNALAFVLVLRCRLEEVGERASHDTSQVSDCPEGTSHSCHRTRGVAICSK